MTIPFDMLDVNLISSKVSKHRHDESIGSEM